MVLLGHVVGGQFCVVAPRRELMLLVTLRWAAPNVDVHLSFVASHNGVVGGKS